MFPHTVYAGPGDTLIVSTDFGVYEIVPERNAEYVGLEIEPNGVTARLLTA